MQAAEGEILTSEESLERLLEEERATANAPKRLRGRGREVIVTGPMDRYLPTQDSPTHSFSDPDDPPPPPIPSTPSGWDVGAVPSMSKPGPCRGWDVGAVASNSKPGPSRGWDVGTISKSSPMPTRSRPIRGSRPIYLEVSSKESSDQKIKSSPIKGNR